MASHVIVNHVDFEIIMFDCSMVGSNYGEDGSKAEEYMNIS